MRSGFSFKPYASCFFAAICLAFPAFADDSGPYSGDKWVFLDSKKVLEAAADITPAKYPDCDEATVEGKMVRVYRPDGTGEAQDEFFTKVLTEKGRRGNRGLTLSFMLPYNTVEVVKVEMLKASGEAVPVDIAANSKVDIDSSQMGSNIYDPNSKILHVNFPKVEIGDVVHTITRNTMLRPIVRDEFAENNVFEGPDYIRHLSYEVHAPQGRPLLRTVVRDEVPGTLKYSKQAEGSDCTVHKWEVTNVPRMFNEPGMPPYEEVLQRVFVSTSPDWPSVSKWYWRVCLPHLETITPEMKKTVTELTANAKSDMERIQALFYYVSAKIRYMGITTEKDRPGYEPHDVRMTFENKYGVCRDKAALLVAMLRAAGFSAYPTLVSVGSKKDPDVADPFFNHAIVGVELKKGEYVLMDPTDENTKELLPSYECDQSYLVSRPEGETLRLSPVVPADENMMRVKTTATLTAAGTLEGKSELWFDGINDNEYRAAFSRMKPNDRQRFFESLLKREMPGAKLKSLKLLPEDMQDVSSAVRAQLEFSAEGMATCGGGKSVVSLPRLGQHLGVANSVLRDTGLEKRKYPLRTEIACGLKEEVQVKLGEGFTGAASMPSYSSVDNDRLSYARSVAFKDGSLAGTEEFKLKAVQFTPAEYLQLKQTLKALSYDERKSPVLTVSSPVPTVTAALDPAPEPPLDSNARVLESHKEIQIKDAHTQVYRIRYSKQMLTYEGKKSEAEVKYAYNPACEEVRLVRAVTTSKDGRRQEVSKDEVHVMDASWNASAKRYTGGKVLVVNLPAVDLGSTIEVELEITTKDRPFLAGFESFQLFDELDKKDVLLTVPVDVPIQTLLAGSAGFVSAETNTAEGIRSFHWRAEHVKALPSESQLPPEWVYMPSMNYFVGDQPAYYKELHRIMLDRSNQRTKAGELAKGLADKAKSRLEAVASIRDFVVKTLRSAGPSFGELPLSELSAADRTLEDGYGHAADRAILFHAMLSAAGFQPEFVLACGLPPIAGITNIMASLPQPQRFQAPLVRVVVEGQTIYLNDTDQYSRLGTTSHDGEMAVVLPDGTSEVIKAAKDCQDKVETTYAMSVADDGKTRVTVTRGSFGGQYNRQNRFFSELPPEERNRYFQQLVSGFAQGARPVGGLVTKFDTYPGVEQFTVEVDNFSIVDGNYSYFDLPFTPSLFPAGAEHRTLPILVAREGRSTVRTEIQLPPGFQHIDIEPRSGSLAAPAGAGNAQITSTNDAGKCVLTYQFETAPAIINPQDYPNLLKLESDLARKSSKLFLLEK